MYRLWFILRKCIWLVSNELVCNYSEKCVRLFFSRGNPLFTAEQPSAQSEVCSLTHALLSPPPPKKRSALNILLRDINDRGKQFCGCDWRNCVFVGKGLRNVPLGTIISWRKMDSVIVMCMPAFFFVSTQLDNWSLWVVWKKLRINIAAKLDPREKLLGEGEKW